MVYHLHRIIFLSEVRVDRPTAVETAIYLLATRQERIIKMVIITYFLVSWLVILTLPATTFSWVFNLVTTILQVLKMHSWVTMLAIAIRQEMIMYIWAH